MQRWCCSLGLRSWLVVGGALASFGNCASAQILPDRTLPNNSNVTTQDNTRVISGGTQAGSNLFHSFEQFSVPTGTEAYFNNTLDIQNIISRVTGSAISNIDGLIRTNGTANLFLLNPNGIIFGPNARLNIGGSFLGSTAFSLNFADGTQFSATAHPTTPLLTVSVPIGLQYGGTAGSINEATSAPLHPLGELKVPSGDSGERGVGIQVQGNGQGTSTTTELIDTTVGLRVQPNQTLALVGGNVVLEGGTLAGGRIELGSVAGERGLVSLTPTDKGLTLGYEGVSSFGDIQISGAAKVDASGAPSGDVTVRGSRVTLQDGSRLAAINLGSQPGGTIAVNASESFELNGTGTFAQGVLVTTSGAFSPSELRNGIFSLSLGSGAAGDVVINTPKFIARNGAFVLTSTFGQGQGGDLTVNSDSVELSASVLATSNGIGVAGAAGNLTIKTGELMMRDIGFASASTLGQGQGGTLTVLASESVELIGSNPFIVEQGNGLNTGFYSVAGTGDAGDAGGLRVATGRLILRDGAAVSASTGGKGQSGNVMILARESVELMGRSPNGQDSSLLAAGTGSESTGGGGNLIIVTGNLIVQDGAGVFVGSQGTGNAGNLEVVADSIRLDNVGRLGADSFLGGEGGDIRLSAPDLQLRHNSQISTNAGIASGAGNGGNIAINADTLVALENSDIAANAFQGRGGNIQINTQGLFLSPDSVITASSEQGINGVVEINTPDIDPSDGLFALPTELVDASGLVASGCAADGGNEFIITGRGGLPPNPRQVFRSNAVQVDWVTLDAEAENRARGVESRGFLEFLSRAAEGQRSSANDTYNKDSVNSPQNEIVEAQGWVVDANGDITLVATAPTATPHSSWQIPADCREVGR